jgi:hypothetical protein
MKAGLVSLLAGLTSDLWYSKNRTYTDYPASIQLPELTLRLSDENGEQAEELWDELNLDLIASYEAEHGEIEIDMWHEDAPEHYLTLRDREELQDKEARRARGIARMKWQKLREPKLPEPEEFRPLNFEACSDLRTQFKDTGLQVIVKMASIELTPEKPMFPEGGWHVSSPRFPEISVSLLLRPMHSRTPFALITSAADRGQE